MWCFRYQNLVVQFNFEYLSAISSLAIIHLFVKLQELTKMLQLSRAEASASTDEQMASAKKKLSVLLHPDKAPEESRS